MPRPKNQPKNKTDRRDDSLGEEIRPKKDKSLLTDFVERRLPNEQEVEKFEKYVKEEIRDNEIDNGLSEIYQDDDGQVVDVKKMEIKIGRGRLYKFFVFLFTLVVFLSLGWLGYYFYLGQANRDLSSVDLVITSPLTVANGQEFFYSLIYKNLENVEINSIDLKVVYPENFIFLEASPQPDQKNNQWSVASLAPHRSGEIKIKGKLIGATDRGNIVLAEMNYTPANFSSQFKKETSFENKISDSGIDFKFAAASNVLVGEAEEIIIRYQAKPENYIERFRLTMTLADNLELLNENSSSSSLPGVWQIDNIDNQEGEIAVNFKIKEKLQDKQNLDFTFAYSQDGETFLPFYSKEISLEIMKRDLNLTLIINGARVDQGVDFGQTLNYSVVYANKGETEMKDIVIMAVLDSDFLNWQSLKDSSGGKVSGKTISWSKEEIPALALIEPEAEGTIDFSIQVSPWSDIDLSKDYQIKSYIQFSVGQNKNQVDEDSRSNTIVNRLNSDLSLKEEVRYFDDDNIAVGSGPLPPKVGEPTSYKVFWRLSNNLNELRELKIETTLPGYVTWNNKDRTALGGITYDPASRKVVWDIGRLPVTVYKSEAEFSISITPTDADKNRIIVLLPGTEIKAVDAATDSIIEKKIKAKTSRLEDDPIVTDDGRVVE